MSRTSLLFDIIHRFVNRLSHSVAEDCEPVPCLDCRDARFARGESRDCNVKDFEDCGVNLVDPWML
jgi:hypothetical protein